MTEIRASHPDNQAIVTRYTNPSASDLRIFSDAYPGLSPQEIRAVLSARAEVIALYDQAVIMTGTELVTQGALATAQYIKRKAEKEVLAKESGPQYYVEPPTLKEALRSLRGIVIGGMLYLLFNGWGSAILEKGTKQETEVQVLFYLIPSLLFAAYAGKRVVSIAQDYKSRRQ